MQVYFIRHGQTNYNLLNLCNDVVDKQVSLTEIGKQQAASLANTLKDVHIDKILVSKLPRTRQTADIINLNRQQPIISHPLLNDIRSGFDSLPVADYQQAIAHDRMHASCNGGESLLQHKQRVLQFLDWLKQQADECVLIIAHEETLRVFKGAFESLNDHHMIDLHFDNCAVLHYTI